MSHGFNSVSMMISYLSTKRHLCIKLIISSVSANGDYDRSLTRNIQSNADHWTSHSVGYTMSNNDSLNVQQIPAAQGVYCTNMYTVLTWTALRECTISQCISSNSLSVACEIQGDIGNDHQLGWECYRVIIILIHTSWPLVLSRNSLRFSTVHFPPWLSLYSSYTCKIS